MLKVIVRPLTPEAFAPFGDVITAPETKGRLYYEDGLSSARPDAWASLSITRTETAVSLPLVAKVLERHEFSSQSFVPLRKASWLSIVAPHHANGGPDTKGALAFLVSPGQGVTYRANVWHHPLAVLEQPAEFAVFMWRNKTTTDEQFVDVEPFLVSRED